jgi:transposase
VTLLPDREIATVQAWLAEHPEFKIVSRDRGGGYGEAAAGALPEAIQVADRWHLMENASAAFLDAVRRSMRGIRTAIGATTINPELLTCAERLRYQGYLRRQDAQAAITALVRNGVPLKEIARRTGHSRNHVRRISGGAGTDVFQMRQSTLDGHLPFLDAQWSGGCRNGAELWRRLKGQGFKGSLPIVTEWATRRRRAEMVTDRKLQKVPAARTIAKLMTTKRDHLTKAETVTVAAIENGVPVLADARALVDRFQAMIRQKAIGELETWIAESRGSLIASFATGIANDKVAVHAAIALPRSNGQVEAQITKLKLVKRQMYGRGKLDLLQARLIGTQ